ncbi:hypothetical protein BC834DRAFT_50154 [Gloeopeniophorella convolvens]|nr:hypothetical protein BC834DRAFT_50154 [Gloeopeniophorella convolvens]
MFPGLVVICLLISHSAMIMASPTHIMSNAPPLAPAPRELIKNDLGINPASHDNLEGSVGDAFDRFANAFNGLAPPFPPDDLLDERVSK